MHARSYIEAVVGLLARGESFEHVLSGLRETLARRGHGRLLPRILRGVFREWKRRSEREGVRVRVAREADEKRYARDVEASLGVSPHTVSVDPSLIGGYTIETKGTLHDRSYKRILRTLYQNILRSN